MSIVVEWLGHACFRITGSNNISVLIDPFDDSIGYRVPDYSCDILLITHDHFDHAAEHFVPPDHVTMRDPGKREIEGIEFEARKFQHDEVGGAQRGHLLAFRFKIDGISFVHLGDIGAVPSGAEMDFLRGVDCLMIPVGGYFTIDADQATEIVSEIKPAYVLPMHYKTRVLTLPIGNVDDFTKGKSDVKRIADTKFTIAPGEIPTRPNIIVLDFM